MVDLAPWLVALPFVLVLGFFVALAVLGGISHVRANRELAQAARVRGWRYTGRGRRQLREYPGVAPFTRRVTGRVRHVVEFPHGDGRAESFEYSYIEGQAGKGRRVAIQVTALLLDARVPLLQIRPESSFDAVRKAVGVAETQFESEAFNRAWFVRGEDPAFTHAVVDPRMMGWLMGHIGENFTLHGSRLYVYERRPFGLDTALRHADALAAFHRRVPAWIWQDEDLCPGK